METIFVAGHPRGIYGVWWMVDIWSFVTGSVDGVQLAAYTIPLNLASSGFVVRKLQYPHYCYHLHMHYIIYNEVIL